MKKVFKFLTDFLLCIVIVAIFFALYGFSQLLIFQKDYASYFGFSIFEVVTGSMAPTININDAIIVKTTSNIKINDIITYKSGNDFITHRVMDIKGDKLITKGDYNNSEDKIINKSDVIGKVVKILPRLGVWKEILLSPTIIIVFLATSIVFSFAFSYKSKNTKNDDDNDFNFNFDDQTNIDIFMDDEDEEVNSEEDILMKKLGDILDNDNKESKKLW